MRAICRMLLLVATLWPASAFGLVHTAPIVLQGSRVKAATHYPIAMYRLFKSDESGKAVPIPFQIDEINEWGDYVLPEGGKVTAATGNGIFDLQDELAFMGDDVGPARAPTVWPNGRPAQIFEIKLAYRGRNEVGDNEGAVYLGVYYQNPPPPSDKTYVFFNRDSAEIIPHATATASTRRTGSSPAASRWCKRAPSAAASRSSCRCSTRRPSTCAPTSSTSSRSRRTTAPSTARSRPTR
jgi:hypothetical protein